MPTQLRNSRERVVNGVEEDGNPEVKSVRFSERNSSAIAFLHGFTGTASKTWDTFICRVLEDGRLAKWDIYSIGYQSRLTVDLPIWTADPKLDVCALGFRTKLMHPPLERYEAVAVVAHSMGGLVVQRAILDNVALRDRISHLVLYGTPSGGLKKARFGRLFKRQLADMVEGGEFVRSLRTDWNATFAGKLPFELKVVAGSEDSFVSAESSLTPFPDQHREVVPGKHSEIVQPAALSNPSYEVFLKALTQAGALRTRLESARLAVEIKDYGSVVTALSSSTEDLDSEAIVILALALESLGRSTEATEVIEKHVAQGSATLDALGVLAGRLKRRWLFSRAKSDYDRSLELYEGALQTAIELGRLEQAYYHSINVAFLKLMLGPDHEGVTEETRTAAKLARTLAEQAHETSWSLATIGEAWLILGELDKAQIAYRRARETSKTIRAQQSMFSQALEVASRVYGEKGERAVRGLFDGL